MFGVIGLGMAGLPLAAVIADNGFETIGIDLDKNKCDLINKGINPISEEKGLNELIKKYGGKKLKASSNYFDASNCDVFIIIVPLFINEDYLPNFDILEHAIRSTGKLLKKGDLVILETTVPPLTTETKVKNWLQEESKLGLGDFYLAYSPERIMTGFSLSRLKEFPKIIGGVDSESGNKGYEIYKNFIPNLTQVSSARLAEFVKVIEGCYRDVNIGLANELYKIAVELDLNFFDARLFANHEYCHIHMPSTGVGGHCIPYYPWFLIKEMQKRGKFSYTELLEVSRKINDEMIQFWAGQILQKCIEIPKPLQKIKICINGISFRKGVKSIHNSRNISLIKYLEQKKLDIYVYDELISREDIRNLGFKYLNPKEADLVFNSFELNFNK